MKIVTRQAGGQLPFVDYIPVIQDYYKGKEASKEASSSRKKEAGALDKALYKVIEEGGLTSDSNYFYSIAETILQDASMGMANGFSSGHTVAQLIQLRKVANQLKENKNQLSYCPLFLLINFMKASFMLLAFAFAIISSGLSSAIISPL